MGTDRSLRVAALGVGALTLALVATTVVLVVATGGQAANQYDRPWAEVVAAVVVLVGTGAGLAIVLQRPRNVIGWIILLPGLTLALEDMAVPAIVTTHVVRDTPARLTEVVAVVSDSLWLPSLGVGVAGLFLLFPDGRFVGRRSRRVFLAAVAASLVFMVTTTAPRQLDEVVAELGHTVASTVHPAHASVWLSAPPPEARP